mmetsp:Transcript_31690/g.79989  ORF Transcript_31690/g.79989 Transcript_31690/m.79989 type:complete len:251 (+) Transcript_31690:1044-1796(+)
MLPLLLTMPYSPLALHSSLCHESVNSISRGPGCVGMIDALIATTMKETRCVMVHVLGASRCKQPKSLWQQPGVLFQATKLETSKYGVGTGRILLVLVSNLSIAPTLRVLRNLWSVAWSAASPDVAHINPKPTRHMQSSRRLRRPTRKWSCFFHCDSHNRLMGLKDKNQTKFGVWRAKPQVAANNTSGKYATNNTKRQRVRLAVCIKETNTVMAAQASAMRNAFKVHTLLGLTQAEVAKWQALRDHTAACL